MTRLSLIGLVLLSVCLPATVLAQIFSPGPLAQAHAHLEGLANCLSCHKMGEKLANDNCLSCHGVIQKRIEQGRGFHAFSAKKSCAECHSEHKGRDYAMVHWPRGQLKFNHRATGFALKAKHKLVHCDDCHDPRLVQDPSVNELLAKKPDKRTFLGAPTTCSACHFDEHRGQLKTTCEHCHNEQGFPEALGFDHNRDSQYELTGKHIDVACENCHPNLKDTALDPEAFPAPVNTSFAKLTEIPHGSCVDCHEDPHRNVFGPNCTDCHSTAGWKNINNPGKALVLHNSTSFPLRGAHAQVACRACHASQKSNKVQARKIPHELCTDCHHDAHFGQIQPTLSSTKAPDCERCHTVESFLPTSYPQSRHQDSTFALNGAHRAVACNACHLASDTLLGSVSKKELAHLRQHHRRALYSAAIFAWTASLEDCSTCHADIHQSQFAHRPEGCSGCHSESSFLNLRFNHERDSRFALKGKHREVPCAGCHPTVSSQESGGTAVRYRPLAMRCMDCHTDPHLDQLARKSDATGRPETRCERCHTSTNFKELVFDHNDPKQSSYPLEGRHQSLACDACHFVVEVAKGVAVRRYRPLPRRCNGCHVDEHGGGFERFQP